MNEICEGFLPAVKVEKMAGVKWRGEAGGHDRDKRLLACYQAWKSRCEG